MLCLGQEQHIGAKAPPREITMENEVMHSEPPIVRCIVSNLLVTLARIRCVVVEKFNECSIFFDRHPQEF